MFTGIMIFLSVIAIFLLSAYDTVAVKLEVSAERNVWNHLDKSCHPVDISWFCSDEDKTCVPDFVSSTDYTGLPDTFSAWMKAYLIKSASIVYDGCFDVPETFFIHLVKHTYTDITSCARICLSSDLVFYSYFGIHGTSCYCLLDSITAHNGIVDVSKTTLENSCLTHETSYMKVYNILKQHDLEKDRCPVAYPISISTVVLYLEDCRNNNTYYCSGDDTSDTSDRAPTSWYQAVKHCAKISTTLVNKFERGSSVRKQYWTHSLQYNEYALNEELPLFETRCAALVRTNTGFVIKALNCSSLLPTLCQAEVSNKTVTRDTVPPYTSSELASNTDHVTKSTVASTQPTRNTSIVKTSDKGSNMSTTPTVFSITIATSKPNTETIVIVLPVVIALVIVALVVGIVIYKRRGDGNSPGGMEGTPLNTQHSA